LTVDVVGKLGRVVGGINVQGKVAELVEDFILL
jgi:hypothetical protein